MKITFLGTGTSQGIPVIGCECHVCKSDDHRDRRLRVSVCVEIQGKNILIDISPDFRYQMLRSGIERIDAILLTHEHRDHVGGLDDIRPINFKYRMDMPLFAVDRVQTAIRKAFDYIFDNDYPGVPKVQLVTIEKDKKFMVGDTPVMPIEIMHAKLPILGFRIGKFAYMTDVKSIDSAQMKYLEGLDVLVLNALQHVEHYSHLTLKQAIELAKKIGAKTTYFTHLSHTMGSTAETEVLLPENMFLAYDDLVIETEDPEIIESGTTGFY
jgi:phosphoribosyl 1,2-cyclic phosphate phosphodiesterase